MASPQPWVHEILRLLAVPVVLSCINWVVMNADFLRRALLTAPRDFKGAVIVLRLKYAVKRAMRKDRGIQEIFLDTVAKFRTKLALVDIDGELKWTFEELNRQANRFAHLFQQSGVNPNDVVALVLPNSAHYVAAWLGCTKIGAVSAWINTNLRESSLEHCLEVSNATLILTSDDLKEFQKVNQTKIVTLKNVEIDDLPDHEPVCDSPPGFHGRLCLIFTSGTTGLPKAAVIKHLRFYYIAKSGSIAFGCNSADRLYLCLPMYHTSAGVLGIGQTIVNGSTCVIARKFGVRRFWKDCVGFECTVSQYIGEICRYLLTAPPSEEEKMHRIRLMIGNGLRPAIWKQFVDRFEIRRIAELFGSTEGTSNLVNFVNKVGACGFIPIYPFIHRLYPVRLYQVNLETGELLRDEENRAIPCQPGETGVLVCRLAPTDPVLHFEGYINPKDTEKRIVHLPEPAFCSGDILEWDRHGYFYFKDRTGDTFRWKGENVSTTEVESVLQDIGDIADAVVFGVEVPGAEGRAGMVAVVVDEKANNNVNGILDLIAHRFSQNLPSYAVPLFARLCSEVDKTGTFKLRRTRLQQEGFDCADKLYSLDSVKKQYVPFEVHMLQKMRF
ncbi:hypothetical protein L596_015774 [Steinernema carpocapsae]|uniref:long-chain-fatty-acid--CoA ligase n=1 Tax=Steinernema carpocapsae TaxID=34508 RepID=A0A4U5NGU3_STECR|nr:hypothetical protein L596_015774 [Steinernema carpocapsae]